MKENRFDIIIAGAGPGGSTASIALRNSGLKIAVVDKAVFPRDKICGDAVSTVAYRVLRQLDPALEQDARKLGTRVSIHHVKLFSPAFQTLKMQFPLEGSCIKRMEFDNWLFEQAKKNPDATFFLGSGVRDVTHSAQGVTVFLKDGTELTAPLVIGCDGAQSVIAKKMAGFTVDKNHYSGAVRQYFSNVKGVASDTLEAYFLKDFLPGYFWIFPLANNQANVGFGMLSEEISKGKIDLKKCMHQIIHEIPEIAERFAEATPLEEPIGFGLPLGSKKHVIAGDRFMLCGDAASLIDPFSGEGIETAMESGKFAAEQAIACFEAQRFDADYMQQYTERVYRKMWPGFRDHYKLQRLLGKRIWLINLVIRIGNIPFVNKRIPKLFY